MDPRTKWPRRLMALLMVALATAGCDRRLAYSHFEHTPLAGWEKTDTLHFDVPPLAQGGSYHETLELRTNGTYPFLDLNLMVEQTVLPSGQRRRQTMECSLTRKDGVTKGKGISHYQYSFPLTDVQLQAGDSLHIVVVHNMKRETLPGIADVGLSLRAD